MIVFRHLCNTTLLVPCPSAIGEPSAPALAKNAPTATTRQDVYSGEWGEQTDSYRKKGREGRRRGWWGEGGRDRSEENE